MRRGAKPGKTKVEAELAAARKSLRNEASKRRELEKRLAESLERETATSEILRVISSSPTHLQPTLHAIAERAARLCDAWNGTIVLSDGEALCMEAHYGPLAEQIGLKLPIDRGSVSGRAFVEGSPVHVDDLSEAADFPLGRQIAAHFGVRTILAVPLVREAVPIGVILIRRTEIRPFSDKQIALLQTFADQAVIAIENARLFNETKEALEQQTATAEILRVISSSPIDVQPVLDAVAEHSARLCGALFASVYRFDGELIHMGAHYNYPPLALERSRQFFPTRPNRQFFSARAILERAVVHVPDVQRDDDHAAPDFLGEVGFRSVLSVPMLRDGNPIGAITVWRMEVGLFTDRQVALLKTFADQAIIAIENVRLFTELEGRNRDLTATSEILRVISSSPTDVQPVFDAIAESARRLCQATNSAVAAYDGALIDLVAFDRTIDPDGARELRSGFPSPPSRDSTTSRAILTRAVAVIWGAGPSQSVSIKEAIRSGFRNDHLISVLWLAEKDMQIVGPQQGKGILRFEAAVPGRDHPLVKEILSEVYQKANKGYGKPENVGSTYYSVGINTVAPMVEGVRIAQARFGDPVTAEKLKQALETLTNFNAHGFMAPITITPTDHEGGGLGRISQWDGTNWVPQTDWYSAWREIVWDMVKKSSEEFKKSGR